MSFTTRHSKGAIYDDPRNQRVSVRQEFDDGFAVSMVANLRVEPDAATFVFTDAGQSWTYYLWSPGDGSIDLSKPQFDALLAARGDLGSLQRFGMDFSLSAMDEKKVIDGVRELFPPAAKLHEAFGNRCWSDVDKLTFKQEGYFFSVMTLADGVQL